ncbi:MAG TPA: (d)CMP kinase [Patescibacteria group bacterium]|nr:(d)CMP kinase [Patescibacteria group bacterium]
MTACGSMVIAVDGPAASGKGTLAKALAAHFGFAYLDTGALYRAVALATIDNGGEPAKIEDVRKVLDDVTHHISATTLTSPRLRTPEIASAAAIVAAYPEVRLAVRDYQVNFSENPPNGAPGAVLDGRDIGTVVCPDAEVKLYVTASADERARRRFLELQQKEPSTVYETVLKDITDRDHQDMNRAHSPLKAAVDANVLDTTTLDRAAALAEAIKIVSAKLPAEKPPAKANGPKP